MMTFLSSHDDTHLPLSRAFRRAQIAFLLIVMVSLIVWGICGGMSGVWGALLGGLLGGFFCLVTTVSMMVTARSSMTTTGIVVLGSWLVKIVVLIIILAIVRGFDFYSRPALVLTTVLSLICIVGAETYAILKTHVPYVQPVDDGGSVNDSGESGQ